MPRRIDTRAGLPAIRSLPVARATADERREQLLALLLRVQREEGARFDVELRQRYLEAGLG